MPTVRPRPVPRRSRIAGLLAAAVAACATLAARPLAAQQLRAALTEGGAPVERAVVTLVDAAGRPVDEGLTSADGVRVLRAPAAGAYTLVVRRIGYRPERYGPWTLAAGEVRGQSVALSAARVSLAQVVTRAEARCGPPDARGVADGVEGERLVALFDAVRTAVAATRAGRAGDGPAGPAGRAPGAAALETRIVRRRVSPAGKVLWERAEKWRPSASPAPFSAGDIAELQRGGYVRNGAWYGFDEQALVHPAFLDAHCFARVNGVGAAEGLVGLHFAPGRGGVTDVAGVVWLDPRSGAPRWADFRFTGVGYGAEVPRAFTDDRFDPADSTATRVPGGRLVFDTAAGRWMVRQWVLRTPVIDWALPGAGARAGRFVLFEEREGQVRTAGAAAPPPMVAARRGRPGTVVGEVHDSLTGTPLGGAEVELAPAVPTADVAPRRVRADGAGRFAFDAAPAGAWRVRAEHPELAALGLTPPSAEVTVRGGDSVRVVVATPTLAALAEASCPEDPAAAARGRGIVQGIVRDAGGEPVADAEVLVWWTLAVPRGTLGDRVVGGRLLLRTTTEDDGRWRVCGVPERAPLRLLAGPTGTAHVLQMLELRQARADAEAGLGAPRVGAPRREWQPRVGATTTVGARGLAWTVVPFDPEPTIELVP